MEDGKGIEMNLLGKIFGKGKSISAKLPPGMVYAQWSCVETDCPACQPLDGTIWIPGAAFNEPPLANCQSHDPMGCTCVAIYIGGERGAAETAQFIRECGGVASASQMHEHFERMRALQAEQDRIKWETDQKERKANPLPPVPIRGDTCPYCHVKLEIIPKSKKACPSCGKFIHVRTKPGHKERELVSADDSEQIDTIDLYLAAAAHIEEVAGQAFNVGGGIENSLSLIELFQFLTDYLGVRLVYKKLP